MTAILFSLLTFVATFFGGWFGLKHRDRLHLIISFTAGVLLSVVFFDILPEIVHLTQENSTDLIYPLMALVGGFLTVYTIEKFVLIHHGHEEDYSNHHHPVVGYVGALGLSFHSFLDGVGIGLGFQVDYRVGLLVAAAVIAHDFCDGLNTVSIMLINKHERAKALKFLILDAVAPILGVLSTMLVAIPQSWLVIYLGVFAGFLLYLGASDLLPEAHREKSSWVQIVLTIAGAGIIFFATRFI